MTEISQLNCIDTERSILALCLLYPDVDDGAVFDLLRPSDFYKTAHQEIFTAMQGMHRRQIEISLAGVAGELMANGKIEIVGGAGYIAGLLDHPVPANIEHAADIVKGFAIRRRLVKAGHDIMKISSDLNEDTPTVIDGAQKAVMDVGEHGGHDTFTALADALDAATDYYETLMKNQGSVIKTGYSGIDDYISPMRGGDFILIAARTSTGKTSLLVSFALNLVKAGFRVGMMSLEMSRQQLIDKILSQVTGINSMRMKTGNIEPSHWQMIIDASARLYDLPLFIDDESGLTANDIRTRARALRQKHGSDILLIDYLGLISPSGNSKNRTKNDQISEISLALKGIARELKIPLIVGCQLNRSVERESRMPQLSDLRDSGALEQDADVVAFLHKVDDKETIFTVKKNRTGPLGTVKLAFDKSTQKFRETFTEK